MGKMKERWGSPVSDDGRGLKLSGQLLNGCTDLGSPVSDDGRGLKQTMRLRRP